MADELLTAQLLRLLAREPRTREDLARRTGVPEGELGELLDGLVRRRLVEERGGAHQLTAAGVARSRWSDQLLLGGPIDPSIHLHAADERRTRESHQERVRRRQEALQLRRRLSRLVPKDPWRGPREAHRRRVAKLHGSQLEPLKVVPAEPGTARWWIHVVAQGVAAAVLLDAAVIFLLLGYETTLLVPAVAVAGAIFTAGAIRAHRGVH